MESGKIDQARAKLDELLAKHKARLPASSVNLFLSMRMRLASNLAEFLTYAPRLPAGFSWNEDEREMAADLSEGADRDKYLAGQTFFDLDGASALNEKLPLSLLQQAAESKTLPEHLRRDVAQAVWLRAVMLDDHTRARELTPTLKSLVPAIIPLLDDYLSRQQADARKFSAIYAWLKFPGLQPIVNSGVGRRTPLDKQDEYRANWWCAAALSPQASTAEASDESKGESVKKRSVTGAGKTDFQFPAFLSEAQKGAARDEHARLTSFGAAPNYLCRQVIEWAERHPTDPRVPEALHLAVKTTRYGCTDKETAKWSKAAFDVLHKRYPNSSWAKEDSVLVQGLKEPLLLTTKHGEHKHTNRLINETSPYLLQHAHNPVDWYAWGEEAFAEARRLEKPVLLSIGYSACHWCHVMEHESFENEEIAKLMNEHFISIKVDREERPDLDQIYMNAVQMLTHHGGWPMTVFLTPEGVPFYGGTYFPPEDRYNMPGFPRVLLSMAQAYRSSRTRLRALRFRCSRS